ncbi:MAG: ergothioneine biosynthesis protein EgtB, partial [Alphaproteobacteria bacterium]|nr:ergothioneine biosynthesis protein EgtB [Alphaproteobacteria bacterium]
MLDIAPPLSASIVDRNAERERFAAIRQRSEALAANLTPEDQAIQSMPDVSP